MDNWACFSNLLRVLAAFALLWASPGGCLPDVVAQRKPFDTNGGDGDTEGFYKPMADLVTPHNYPLEEHFVVTRDGYILRLFRIPHGPSQQTHQPQGHQQQQLQAQANVGYKPKDEKKQPSPGGKQKQLAAVTPRRLLSNNEEPLTKAVHSLPPALLQERAILDDAVLTSEYSDSSNSAPAIASTSDRGRSASAPTRSRPVVYLQHALVDSSADWVLQGPNKSLAFVLADAGFDVWMGNLRGSRFSRNHTTLDPDKSDEFWSFSFDEHAAVDLIDLVNATLIRSGASHLAYVGYSQGTMIAFAALASQPWLVERVTVAVLLAPVAFVTKITSLPMRVGAFMDSEKFFELLGVREYAPHTAVQSALMHRLCSFDPSACLAMLGALGGSNDANVNKTLLPAFFDYFPAGTSVQNMAHWSQLVRQLDHSRLQKYDWGQQCQDSSGQPKKCNWRMYGQAVPPAYNLSSITTPLALFTGGQDALADPADVSLLLKVLPPDVVSLHHHEPSYCHWDFGIGSDLPQKVYPLILQLIRDHQLPSLQ